MHLAFPMVGTQSSITYWGKVSPFVLFSFVTCFHFIPSSSSGEDSEWLPLFHLLHPLMPEQTSFAVPSAVSKSFCSPLTDTSCIVTQSERLRHVVRHG